MTAQDLFLPAPLWLLAAAVGLEWKLTWPRAVPHPVRVIGWLLDRLERLARSSTDLRLSGALSLAAALAVVGLVCAALVRMPILGWVAALVLAALGLAHGELVRTCREALYTLETDEAVGELTESRRCVGQLVSRDTATMDAAELRRALAETLAENFNDAVVAPLFWLAVGGPVGLWLYKTVSTMDSMWGYTTPQWKDLGMAGARCDDVLAWVPARLSVVILWLAWQVRRWEQTRCWRSIREQIRCWGSSTRAQAGDGMWPGWRTIREQAGRMSSPNAGWPMATVAWLHGAVMGGPTPYFGTLINKPLLGPEGSPKDAPSTAAHSGEPADTTWTSVRLENLIAHVRCAGWVALALAGLLHIVL